MGNPKEIIEYDWYGKCLFYPTLEVFLNEENRVDYFKYMIKRNEVFSISLLTNTKGIEAIKFFKKMALAKLFYMLQHVKCDWTILNSGGKYDNDFLVIEVNKVSKIWYDLGKNQIDFISAATQNLAIDK